MKNLIVPKIESYVGRNHLPAAEARFANWATQFQYWLHMIHWVLPYDYNLTFQVCLLYSQSQTREMAMSGYEEEI